MKFHFSEHAVTTPVGKRIALVIAPNETILVEHQETQQRSAPLKMSATDAEILRQAELRAPRIGLCIFRGVSEDQRVRWRFEPGLSEEQAEEIARAALPGQMIVYRQLLRRGIALFLHVDWGHAEATAYRRAVARRAARLSLQIGEGDGTSTPDPRDVLDLWILRNLVFFFTLKFERLVATILPEKLALMDKRMARIQEMAQKVPELGD